MSVLFLIGPRGSGKSMAARLLGTLYGYHVCDTDQMILSLGRSIADIVAAQGWEAFRALEKTILAKAVAMMRAHTCAAGTPAPGVIATGGGIVLAPENRALMRENGIVAYLAAPEKVLVKRLTGSPDDFLRPPLSGLSFADEIRAVISEREPLYRETAHHIVDAALEPENVARMLSEFALRKILQENDCPAKYSQENNI